MTHQQRWQAYSSNSNTSTSTLSPTMQEDASATFVKTGYLGSAQSFSPYTFSEEVIPPPPPYLYQPLPRVPKRNKAYVIVLLVLLVMGLGSLEIYQVVGGILLAHETNVSQGSNQSILTVEQPATAFHKVTPVLTVTPGTIKETILLSCGACDDPIHTTINAITIDTTNQRMIWVVKLNNVSGSEQVDNFANFNLQDPNGNTYEGTGNLNTVFIVSAGQIVLETEDFSFLPRPDVPYTLIAHLGISGRTYDPIQFTF